jgi:hypothetical protein
MQKGRGDLWTYFTGSYVDGSDDVLWLRDPTGRREVSFVYDPARHRIVDGDVRSFNQDRGLKASAIDDDQYQFPKKENSRRERCLFKMGMKTHQRYA